MGNLLFLIVKMQIGKIVVLSVYQSENEEQKNRKSKWKGLIFLEGRHDLHWCSAQLSTQ
jgi:hypothetical protein